MSTPAIRCFLSTLFVVMLAMVAFCLYRKEFEFNFISLLYCGANLQFLNFGSSSASLVLPTKSYFKQNYSKHCLLFIHLWWSSLI
jgi:hypothetical protein